MSLRTDLSQWLIYDEETVRTVEGALEIYLMAVGGTVFSNADDVVLRAMGHSGMRIATTRLELWLGKKKGLDPTELQEELAIIIQSVIAWRAGKEPRPDDALDEIHAVLVWLDKRTKAAGVNGPGWYREVVRESQSGR